MGFDVSIIDKNGEELPESNELYFNYLRNPFGFHQFILHNTGIDIRAYPLFPYKEDYKDVYPGFWRKIRMLRIATKIVDKISSMATLEVKFEDFSWQYFKDTHEHYLTDRQHYAEGMVVIRLPRNAEIDPNDLDASYMSHEKYVEWTVQFLKLMTLLHRKNNGFYVSS